jgi:CRP-like cAMP-binding protein
MLGLPVFLGRKTAHFKAVVQVPGGGRRLPADLLRAEVRRGGALARLLALYADAFLGYVGWLAACNAHHSVEKRCCRWLLLAHDQVGQDRFPLTQKYLAAMLGVRRMGVAKVAAKLRQAGRIHYSRGRVTVLDRTGLEADVCSCYHTIRASFMEFLAEYGA